MKLTLLVNTQKKFQINPYSPGSYRGKTFYIDALFGVSFSDDSQNGHGYLLWWVLMLMKLFYSQGVQSQLLILVSCFVSC